MTEPISNTKVNYRGENRNDFVFLLKISRTVIFSVQMGRKRIYVINWRVKGPIYRDKDHSQMNFPFHQVKSESS